MTDVFISYKREERPRCARIAEKLRNLGLDVWFDAKLESGMSFDSEIESKVNSAKAVLVLWSPLAVKSTWVRNEATLGARRDVLVSAELAACDLPVQFVSTHTDKLHDANFTDTDPGWLAIVRRVGKLAAKPHLVQLADALAGTETAPRRSIAPIIVASLLGLVVGAGGGYVLGPMIATAIAPADATASQTAPLADAPVAPTPGRAAPPTTPIDLVGAWGGGDFKCGQLEVTLELAARGLRVGVGSQAPNVEPLDGAAAGGWLKSGNGAAPNYWRRDGEYLVWRIGSAEDAASETRLSKCTG